MGKLINGIHPDDQKGTTEAVLTALAEDHTYEIEYRMLKKDGSFSGSLTRGK